MGNCFSDPSSSTKHGKGQKLGSGPSPSTSTPAPPPSSGSTAHKNRNTDPPRTLGGGPTVNGADDGDARDRALRAAEERANAAKKKGVNTSNPKAGQLSSKLEQDRRTATSPVQNPNERMMDRGDWN